MAIKTKSPESELSAPIGAGLVSGGLIAWYLYSAYDRLTYWLLMICVGAAFTVALVVLCMKHVDGKRNP